MSESTRLERRGSIFILYLGDDENRFNFDSIAKLTALYAEVEAAPGPRALVTVGEGKFFSNGFDLDWLQATGTALEEIIRPTQELFATLLGASFPMVAAIQGHCYAGGAMLALCHDVRIMREDRGFLCFPEIDIKLTFTPGMNDLLVAKMTPQTAHQAMVLGRRYTAPTALEAGIIDQVASEDELLDAAIAAATELLQKDPVTLAGIKTQLYAKPIASLRGPLR